MTLHEFINRLDSIVRGDNVNEWNINVKDNGLEEYNLFIHDQYGYHHEIEIEVDKVNKDISLRAK